MRYLVWLFLLAGPGMAQTLDGVPEGASRATLEQTLGSPSINQGDMLGWNKNSVRAVLRRGKLLAMTSEGTLTVGKQSLRAGATRQEAIKVLGSPEREDKSGAFILLHYRSNHLQLVLGPSGKVQLFRLGQLDQAFP